jgi:hypothetical protein
VSAPDAEPVSSSSTPASTMLKNGAIARFIPAEEDQCRDQLVRVDPGARPPHRDRHAGCAGHHDHRARDLVSGDGMQRFEFGLDMLIDGLAEYVER